MKIDRRLKTTLGLLTCACALLTVSAKADTQDYLVNVTTSSLIGNANGPFYLDFQLNYGSGTIGNSAVISNFSYNGGSVVGTPTVTGTAAGGIDSVVTLSDNSSNAFNELFQGFTPGTSLSFVVAVTNNTVGTTPDALEFAILDKTTGQIPTADPNDELSLADFEIGYGHHTPQQITANAYNGINDPNFGGDYTGVTTTITAIATPEPSSWALTGLCVGMFAFLRRRLVRQG